MKVLARRMFCFAVAVLGQSALANSAGAQAVLQLGEATAAPGQTGLSVPISFTLDPDEPEVTGMEFIISYDPAVIGGVSIETEEPLDFFRFMEQGTWTNPGNVGAALIWDLFNNGKVAPSGVIAELRFCVLGSAATGASELGFLESADRRIGGRVTVLAVYTAGGASHKYLFDGGAVLVDGEPVGGGGCPVDDRTPPDGPPPPPPRPEVLEATYMMADAAARPGGSVHLPFIINANAEVSGFSFSVDFDEALLRGDTIDEVFVRPDGEEYEFKVTDINNEDASHGNGGIDEGFLAGAIIFSFDANPVVLPREQDNEVLSFQLTVAGDAPPGVTSVRFVDGGRTAPTSQPVNNVATIFHESVSPDEKPSMILVDSLLAIVGDASAFVRGDANGDNRVDLSDAVHTLSFLFRGGPAPFCYDAADANDDGLLNIADPVRTLGRLFLGTAVLPEPSAAAPGEDPTPDAMTCLTRG